MKVALISTHYMPHPTGYGVSVALWGILHGLLERGHSVFTLTIAKEHPESVGRERMAAMAEIGCNGVVLGPLDKVSPALVESTLLEEQPDVLVCYTAGALSYVMAPGLESIPKICITVDLDFQVPFYRRQYVNRSVPITYAELASFHTKAMEVKSGFLSLLRTADVVIEQARHHADWMNQMGIPAQYVPMTVPDPAFPGWRRNLEDLPQNPKPRVLLAGHIGGIATMSGLYYLVEDVFPGLNVDEFEWRIAGADSLTPDLATRFRPYPSVKFLGYVPDIHAEILSSDIFFCPTPIDLGFRTRLAEVAGLGGCIVTHSANALGMPELEHGVNCYMATSGFGLGTALGCLAMEENREHRLELGNNARTTYERHFAPDQSSSKVAAIVERTVQSANPRLITGEGGAS